jgi:AcrR family transcriptional regulator
MAITDRKLREKEQRRNSIITAAEKLFYARGYDNVSMNEIAQMAELSKGALYFYFKKKDTIFFAIVIRKQTELVDLMAERLKDKATGREKLRAIIECSVDFTKRNPDYNDMACTFGPVILSRMDTDDEILFEEKTNEYNALLSDAIKKGREDGTIRKDINVVLMGFYITLITISVVSPLPTWKKAFALSGISFHQFLDSYSCFIDPAISKCFAEDNESSKLV